MSDTPENPPDAPPERTPGPDAPPAPPAPPDTKKPIADRIIRGSAAVLLARGFLILSGLVFSMSLAGFFKASPLTAGLLFAFNGIIMQFFFMGEKLIPPPFVPVFMEQLDKRSEADAWRTASALFNVFGVFLAAAALMLTLFPSKPVEFFAWLNKRELDPETAMYATHFVRWCVPTMLGLVLGSVTYAVLISYKRFFLASFGEAATKLIAVAAVIAGGLTMRFHESAGPTVLAAVLLTAGFARLLTHMWALRDRIRLYRPVFWSPAMRKYLLLAAPIFVGVIVARSRDVYNQYGAFIVLPSEVLTANDFGRKIFTATTGMVPFAVSIAMFPFFCEMVDRDDKASLADYLTRAARMLVLVFAPMAAGAVVLSLPVSRLLFGSMGLSSYVVWLVATANVCYVLVIPAMAVEPAVMQAFFSDRRTIAPTAIGIVMSTASMVWSWYAIAVLQLGGPAAITAVALGYTASRYLKVVCLVVVLRWTVPAFALPSTLWYLARLLVVMAITGGIAWEVRMLYESRVEVYCGSLGFAGAAVRIGPELAVAAAAGAVFFLAGCWVLRLGELGEMLSWAKQKIRRRGTGAGPGGASPAGGVE